MVKSRKRSTRFVAWVPALVVICTTAFTASGLSLIPGATASSVNVNGSVGGSIATDASPDGGCAAGLTLTSFASAFDDTATCQITYAANSRSEVVFSDANGAAAGFFCGDQVPGAGGARTCAADVDRLENVAAVGSTITTDTVGLALLAVAGDGGNAAGSGVSGADLTPTAGEAIWSPITNATRQLCLTTASNAAATCDFRVGGEGEGATQSAGDYTGTITLTTQVY